MPGVSEVASVGGMVKQYQVVLDPDRLRAYNLPLTKVRMAIQRANQEVGGSVIEMAEAEYMVRATGYVTKIDDLRQVPLGVNEQGTPILLKDVSEVRLGPQMRRGIAELDGEGEVAGGIVVMRYGENALKTIEGVKQKLAQLQKGLPDGVEIVETYDRSALIKRAVNTLGIHLVEEFLVVVLVCALFLFHFRSSLVILISLPVGILVAFLVMRAQGINANIMSLGGIAIAIGAMVDAAIVMIKNAHKHLEHAVGGDSGRIAAIKDAAIEVGPPLFFSLLIITLSFLPVFTLEAWSMSIPAISSAPDDLLLPMVREWGRLPFLPVTTVEDIAKALRYLRDDEAFYSQWVERGKEHGKIYHSPKVVARRFVQLCEGVL